MSANTALQNDIFAGRRPQASLAFRTAPPNGIAMIDRLGTVAALKRDDTLFREGDLADCYFKVVTGAVRGCKLLADGRRHIGDFFLPGDFIGLDAAETYAFSAEAVSDTTIIRYARRKVDALVWQEPQVAKSLVKMMREGLCAARERMTLLGHMTAMERIASFLLTMADRTGDAQISIPMTRTDIGDYLGLTMETVSRAFSQLKSDGVIKQKSVHEVVIADRDALEELGEVA
jgi:CRP/FNR family transcriptional regulator, anaerobic regulatory protein